MTPTPQIAVADRIETVTAANFDRRVLRVHRPVVVESILHNCPHCRRMEPVLREFAKR